MSIMRTLYTKDYIESITGMAFEDFIDAVRKHGGSQAPNLKILQNHIVMNEAVELALNDLLAESVLYDQIEPSASDDDQDEVQENEDITSTEETVIETVLDNLPKLKLTENVDASDDGFRQTNNVSFERTVEDVILSVPVQDNVVTTNTLLAGTYLSYSNPSEFFTSAVYDNPKIIIDQPNVSPLARSDFFFGFENTAFSGNLITDNGNGADIDPDGSVLRTVAGSFVTEQNGVVNILENGDFTYTHSSGFSGVDRFSYSITDADGATDSADATFAVSVGERTTFVDFSAATITGYGGSGQNRSDLHSVQDDGDTIQLSGNTWKDISFPYTVTANTVLEFEFMSTARGEIHGLGFDTNDSISSEYTFKLYGTQAWGITDFNTYAANEGEWVSYSITVGDYYTGSFDRLFFVMDNDANTNSNSFFRNLTLLEQGTSASEKITGSESSKSLYGYDGDDVLYGLGGDDVLNGGSGVDFLFGGAGADTFIFDDFSNIDYVQDFNTSEGDALDISSLLIGYDPLTDAINEFLEVTTNGTDTFVAVDTDGGRNNFVDVAILHNVNGLPSESDLEASGTIVTV